MDRRSDTLLVQMLMERDEHALRTAIDTYGRRVFRVAAPGGPDQPTTEPVLSSA